MFGIGGFELFIIVLFGFLIFGPDKLPDIARTLGAFLRKFQEAQKEMEAVIKDEVTATPAPKKPKPTGVSSSGVSLKPRSQTGADVKKESFAERKARYDRQRAAREREELNEIASAQGKQKAPANNFDAPTSRRASGEDVYSHESNDDEPNPDEFFTDQSIKAKPGGVQVDDLAEGGE